MSTYVIGDVHGEFNQLLELLNTMDFSSKDWLYVMGDVVDKVNILSNHCSCLWVYLIVLVLWEIMS